MALAARLASIPSLPTSSADTFEAGRAPLWTAGRPRARRAPLLRDRVSSHVSAPVCARRRRHRSGRTVVCRRNPRSERRVQRAVGVVQGVSAGCAGSSSVQLSDYPRAARRFEHDLALLEGVDLAPLSRSLV